MNKIILSLILVSLSTPIFAEWVKVSNTADYDVYVDNRSIKLPDNTIKMWVLYDYNLDQGSTFDHYLSVKYLNQYQCINNTSKMLVSTHYDGHATTGKVVETLSRKVDYIPIPKNTIAESLLNVACSKLFI